MKIFILTFLVCTKVFALEAVITVLEAPMFREPNLDSFVVQYLRKGDVIKVHPSLANSNKYEKYRPDPKKYQLLKKKMEARAEYNQDPIFRGEKENTYFVEDEFIPTIDRLGHRAWILSDHIYVYFKDPRELDQKQLVKDPTDYRLQEPLPKTYPLIAPSGLRGQLLFGVTQPYSESYPYLQSVKTKSYNSPMDMNFTMLKEYKQRYDHRFFYGGTVHIRSHRNRYSFDGGRLSEEFNLKFGFGPTLSYDAYKGEKNRLVLSSTVILDLIDRVSIKQQQAGVADERLYTGISLSPRLNLQYHRKNILEELDFVLGTSLEMGLPTRYTAQDGGSQKTWWNNLGADKFTTRATLTVGGYIGIQSAY